MCIQREPQHLHSNAVFIGLCPPPAREDDKQSLPQRSFHVFNHPRHASGFLPGPPSLQSVSFCGEAGQVPCLGWRAVSHESLPLHPQVPNSLARSNSDPTEFSIHDGCLQECVCGKQENFQIRCNRVIDVFSLLCWIARHPQRLVGSTIR